ncbi:hypothetical protein NDU88_004165 [Pleurodeles waltl]|uniref:Uncharacterized protein n=1 Tax=Pleurodeles waltl TaxID=8319 RepID=A0AAV7M5J4_PLEWA|nr:hypothetical protein NDU88_004165 [Pleurodeles waltl]
MILLALLAVKEELSLDQQCSTIFELSAIERRLMSDLKEFVEGMPKAQSTLLSLGTTTTRAMLYAVITFGYSEPTDENQQMLISVNEAKVVNSNVLPYVGRLCSPPSPRDVVRAGPRTQQKNRAEPRGSRPGIVCRARPGIPRCRPQGDVDSTGAALVDREGGRLLPCFLLPTAPLPGGQRTDRILDQERRRPPLEMEPEMRGGPGVPNERDGPDRG